MIIFDKITKLLTFENYSGVDLSIFGEMTLIFQSKLFSESSSLSPLYPLVKISVSQLIEPRLPDPPAFEPPLQPILIELDFENDSDFEIIEYTLPNITDSTDSGVLPIEFLNLEEFSAYVTFDKESSTVAVDPNLIPEDAYDSMVVIDLKLENKSGLSAKYMLSILVTNTAPEDIETGANDGDKLEEEGEEEGEEGAIDGEGETGANDGNGEEEGNDGEDEEEDNDEEDEEDNDEEGKEDSKSGFIPNFTVKEKAKKEKVSYYYFN